MAPLGICARQADAHSSSGPCSSSNFKFNSRLPPGSSVRFSFLVNGSVSGSYAAVVTFAVPTASAIAFAAIDP